MFCSTPFNSGNSASTVVPPSATNKSEAYPKDGFAEIPENPSEPPHSKPTINLLSEVGVRLILFASIKPIKVCFTASSIKFCSLLLFCCSK